MSEHPTRLEFRDDTAFYQRLLQAMADSRLVEVQTHYRSVHEVPARLRQLLRLDDQRVGAAVIGGAASGLFTVGAMAHTALNLQSLYVFAGAAVGAGAGLAIAGPVGAVVGGALGTAIGAVAAAARSDNFDAEVEVDAAGRLTFRIRRRGP